VHPRPAHARRRPQAPDRKRPGIQEMLEDVYIRELMRQYWEETLQRIRREA